MRVSAGYDLWELLAGRGEAGLGLVIVAKGILVWRSCCYCAGGVVVLVVGLCLVVCVVRLLAGWLELFRFMDFLEWRWMAMSDDG